MGLVRDLKLLKAWNKFRGEAKNSKGNMVKLIPSFVTLGITAISLFQPELQALLVAHPTAYIVISGIYALVNHMMPSPLQSSTGVAPAKK